VTEHPDVVLMDVMMPRMDGYTAVGLMKAQMEPAPLILMLTAKGSGGRRGGGLSGGADDYVIKPFVPRELIARINVGLIKFGKSPVMTTES
jgi:DNA-binding response OmpR family regulator